MEPRWPVGEVERLVDEALDETAGLIEPRSKWKSIGVIHKYREDDGTLSTAAPQVQICLLMW